MAKLSKRELAVKSKKKAAIQSVSMAPKTPTPRKTVAPLVGEGPLLPGQVRVGGTVTGAGPLLPGQTRKQDSYTGGGNTREQAAKAKSNKNSSGLSGAPSNISFGGAGGGKALNTSDISKDLYSGGLSMRGGEGAAPMTKTGRFLQILNDPFNTGADITKSIKQKMGPFGNVDYSSLLGVDKYLRDVAGIPTTHAQAMDPTNVANQNILELGGSVVGLPPSIENNQPFNDTDGDGLNGADSSIFDTRSGNATNERGNTENNKKNDESYDNGAYPVPGVESNLADILKNVGPADAPLADNPGPTIQNRSGRGNGSFGTGKGLMSDDPYIKELRKAYSSNGGEKWLRKQFEELISALDPTYAQLQKEGTDALNAQLNTQNNQLASVMNAGNVGDSEQRAQLMAQQQANTQTALGNLLAKLAQQKAGDVSNYKSQMADKIGQYKSQQQSNQQRLMEQIQQYRQRQEDQAYKNASLSGRGGTPTKAGSLTYLGDDANGNPVYYNTTTGQRTTEAGLKRKQSNPLEEAMAALLGQEKGGPQVQYDENGRPYIEQ